MKTISTKSLLEYISSAVTSNSEEDQSYLMRLLSPSDDRDEMGIVYNEIIGYNPITHFDERDLTKLYSGIINTESFNKAPDKVKTFLTNNENKDKIISLTLSMMDDDKEEYLIDLLTDAIKYETDWAYDPSDCAEIGAFDSDETDDDLCEESDDCDEEDDEGDEDND